MRKSFVAALSGIALVATQACQAGVWLDDSLPGGAGAGSTGGETWSWVSSSPAPYSGSLAHQSTTASGLHAHSFNWASTTMSVNTGDSLSTYVYLDPAHLPSEIMISWCTTASEWEHRAYWGANQIAYGTDGTASRHYMGPLPAAGQWVQLSVPASTVNLEGKTLQGMDFAVYNGRATWDKAGTSSGGATGGSTGSTNSVNSATNNFMDYDALALPDVGGSMLRILSPTLLELHYVNSAAAGGAVSSWNFVNSGGLQLPALSQFVATANGLPLGVQSAGFKRRPFYAPSAQRDLRIDNCIYLKLSSSIADGAQVTVLNPSGLLWGSSIVYSAQADPKRYNPAIHVNQEGYVSNFPKKAMVGYYLGSYGEMDLPSTSFSVVDAASGSTVFNGTLTTRADSGYSYSPAPYQKVYQADFSSVTTPGQYILTVPGMGASMPFRIDDGVAMAFARAYELGLYHQRCGTSNAMPFTRYTHDACHTAAATVPLPQSSFAFTWSTISNYAQQTNPDNPAQIAPKLSGASSQLYPIVRTGAIDTAGGHHDAGDYSKYTINCASLTHELIFSADSLAGVSDLDNLGIPESGDGISDILQEAKWEADYLAKIQDTDGGFFFLVYPQNREYENNVTPDHGDPQVVWPKTTSVTAAAVAALAECASSPLMKQAYPAAAALYLQKAKLGWQFLTNAIALHGKAGSYQKITHYGDVFTHDDELAWAACEMFLATGDQNIHQTLKSWFPDPTDPATFRWGWWRQYACYGNAVRSYAFAVRSGRLAANQVDANYMAKCVTTITNAANDAVLWSQQCAYGSSFPSATKAVRGAGWYFSASQGFDIAVGYQIQARPEYLDAMVANMNYEGGCNPVNSAYVTGLGWKRQRQIVDQYAWNTTRVFPPTGIPIASIQTGFIYTYTYGTDLSALTYPSDDASTAPYPFYDRWGDTVNVTTEFVVTDQARGLGTVAFLAAMTPLKNQAWRSAAGQITGVPSPVGQNVTITPTLVVPGMDLSGAKIIWEAKDQQPAYGPNFSFNSGSTSAMWIEAEAYWPDGRRVFATFGSAISNGLPFVTLASSDATMTEGISSDTATFTLTRNGDTSSPLTISLQTAGTATKWNDYRRPAGDMPDVYTIPAGQTTLPVSVYAPTNGTLQSPLTATLTLVGGTGYNIGNPASVTLNIVLPGTGGSVVDKTVANPSLQKAAGRAMKVSWPSTAGKHYKIVYTSDLRSQNWIDLVSNIAASGSSTSWTDASAASASQRFYKVIGTD